MDGHPETLGSGAAVRGSMGKATDVSERHGTRVRYKGCAGSFRCQHIRPGGRTVVTVGRRVGRGDAGRSMKAGVTSGMSGVPRARDRGPQVGGREFWPAWAASYMKKGRSPVGHGLACSLVLFIFAVKRIFSFLGKSCCYCRRPPGRRPLFCKLSRNLYFCMFRIYYV